MPPCATIYIDNIFALTLEQTMGLTISWKLHLNSASIDEVRDKIVHLRKLALKLPFTRVEDLVEIEGEACKFDKDDVNDPHVFLKLRGLKPSEMAINGFSAVNSTYLIAFDSLPGEGCETAAFGLAAHSDPLEAVDDWRWMGFCKTSTRAILNTAAYKILSTVIWQLLECWMKLKS